MKTYPTEALLSITTGVLLCEFSAMHECCEYLVGSPIFTHQFAHRPFSQQLRDAVWQQHPQLRDVDAAGIDSTNWQQFRDKQIARFGERMPLEPMAEAPSESAASFTEPLRGKEVIGVVA